MNAKRAARPRLFLTSSCTSSPSTFASMWRATLVGRQCGSNSNVPVIATQPVRCSLRTKVPGCMLLALNESNTVKTSAVLVFVVVVVLVGLVLVVVLVGVVRESGVP